MDQDGNVDLTELNGKPVMTAIGRTPLEAWSNCLIKLGLVDEIHVDTAMEAVKAARKESRQEAKGKLDGKKRIKQRGASDDFAEAKRDKPRGASDDYAEIKRAKPRGASEDDVEEEEKDDASKDERDDAFKEPETAEEEEDTSEPISEEEQELLDRLASLREELAEAKDEDDVAAIALADARIGVLGRFMCNPFGQSEGGKSHQASWMAAAVRKEKTKMGSTGNKRKIVTATDLLERNDTFYNGEIESLIEGLPGSEYCNSYLYQANRGAVTASRAWLHEQQLRQEREKQKRLKQSKEAKAKASQQKEREMKRKRREDERDERKRVKVEEEEGKKKARVEERLSRLSVQVGDRLNKEASFQREKVVLLMSKNLLKEFSRRRKAAELVAGQTVGETKPRLSSDVAVQDLPPLSRQYDEDIVRIWDFMSTFGTFFVDRGYVEKLPTLDSLQSAIDTLRGSKTEMSKVEAMSFVTDLAVSLCKPLAAGLTRMLFASLIALNPALQKDFGAAFFNEVNSTKTKEEPEDSSQADVLLPVDTMTWKEIARIAFQSDALGELGYNRQETAHLLRGYRSAGHPNSKEARRLRRVEDFSIALLRQTLSENQLEDVDKFGKGDLASYTIRINIPSTPSCGKSDFLFYLHNVKSLKTSDDVGVMKENLTKALGLVNSGSNKGSDVASIVAELEKCMGVLPSDESNDAAAMKKARQLALQILDRVTGEVHSRGKLGEAVIRETSTFTDNKRLVALEKLLSSKLYRSRMGELESLVLTPNGFKELTRVREEYMSEALRLKEEMARQELKEAGDEYDDDDDDEDDDDENQRNGKETKSSNAEVVGETNDKEPTGEKTAQEASDQNESNNDGTDAASQKKTENAESKIGKETQYDDFCADIPSAPELIRRCLAVLRTLSQTGPAEPFIYPVDPQTNPGYYDMLIRPMCIRQIGVMLQNAAEECSTLKDKDVAHFVELAVADFARKVRLIGKNCLSYANAGPTVISAGGEMLRIFERLLLDWVLAPEEKLAPLDKLDDDLCVDPHPSDVEATVLLCDGCEGNFNIGRLDPPLLEIPKGDWHCPRCLKGRWWGDLDPRIGKEVKLKNHAGTSGKVKQCLFCHFESEGERPSLMYEVEMEDGSLEKAKLHEIDEALREAGQPVSRIRCPEAVSESVGYGAGIDHGTRHDLVPVLLNPNVSDSAAQVALSSSVFRDSIAATSTLLINDPQEMTATEWLRLLVLLIMKCSSSDVMQNVASEMENKAAERMVKKLESLSKINDISQVLPAVTDDEEENLDKPGGEEAEEVEATSTSVVASGTDKTASEAKPSAVPSSSKPDESTLVVEASAVEVVDGMEVEGVPSNGGVAYVEAEAGTPEEDEFKAIRSAALADKSKRQKAREDSIAAFCIKNQLRSTVASFEQDSVSHVVEAVLATKDPGLSFSASRCRGVVCDFCGLSDTALGTNLVRVPDDKEWDELINHASRSRRTQLVADLHAAQDQSTGNTSSRDNKLMKLSIRIGDELVSDEQDESQFDQIPVGGMLEFLPRNPDGFQEELKFRYESGLPFVTGSLTGHECCAVAAHNARKVNVVQKFKERQAELVELEEGNTCGRTLEIGKDAAGRSYWTFNSDPNSLFVCLNGTTEGDEKWHKYADPETIASVLMCLGKDPIVQDLKRVYPKALRLLKNGLWSDLLLKRRFKLKQPKMESEEDSSAADVMDVDSDSEKEDLYEEGEEVLVESKDGKILWDANIIGAAKSGEGKVTGYRVTYTGWSSRFDEWVAADRVVEPSDNNRRVQEEMMDEVALSRDGLPASLDAMEAKSYLRSRDRARGSLPLPDFARLAQTGPHDNADDKIFATMKAASLAIEAALPIGSVHNTDNGAWNPEFAKQWRLMVQQAIGPWDLTRCVILLEDTISEEWINPQIGHLRACLPSRWKALDEASPSSLALRIFLLDRGILYDNVDKKRYKPSKSKK